MPALIKSILIETTVHK